MSTIVPINSLRNTLIVGDAFMTCFFKNASIVFVVVIVVVDVAAALRWCHCGFRTDT